MAKKSIKNQVSNISEDSSPIILEDLLEDLSAELLADTTYPTAADLGINEDENVDDADAHDLKLMSFKSSFSASKSGVNLDVPFIHQLWDTPDSFNGYWACGAVSSLMVIAYYKLLPPHIIRVKGFPAYGVYPHQSAYGFYVSEIFNYKGFTFNDSSRTENGTGFGIYGTCLDNHPNGWMTSPYKTKYAPSKRGRGIQSAMEVILPLYIKMDIKAKGKGAVYTEEEFKDLVIPILNSGDPVIVGGNINNPNPKVGHIIVIKGYMFRNGQVYWICNDPFGDMTTGKGYSGKDSMYTWANIRPRWMCRFFS